MADGLADELGQRLGEGSDGVGEGGVGGRVRSTAFWPAVNRARPKSSMRQQRVRGGGAGMSATRLGQG